MGRHLVGPNGILYVFDQLHFPQVVVANSGYFWFHRARLSVCQQNISITKPLALSKGT